MKKIDKRFLLNDVVVSVIVTTNNDEDIIIDVLKKIHKELERLGYLYEIFVIDNNSSDKTIKKIRQFQRLVPQTRSLVLSKKYPKEVAITAGLDNCIGDLVLLLELYSDPVEIIKPLIQKLEQGFDVIIGKQISSVTSMDWIGKLLVKLVERLSTQGFEYRTNFTLGLSRKAVNAITKTRRKSRNFSYINFLIGLRKSSFEYSPETKYLNKMANESLAGLLMNLLDIIMSNSFKPIRIITITGMIASSLFILYVLVIIVLVLVFGMKQIAPQGWISLATILGTFFLLLFSILTIIAEYMIRILNETRDEPLYFVAEEFDSGSLTRKKRLNVI